MKKSLLSLTVFATLSLGAQAGLVMSEAIQDQKAVGGLVMSEAIQDQKAVGGLVMSEAIQDQKAVDENQKQIAETKTLDLNEGF